MSGGAEIYNFPSKAGPTEELATTSEAPPLPGGGGGSTYDGMLEARVAKVEASVTYIEREVSDLKSEMRGLRSDARTDFRLLFGAIIAVALGLAGLMAKGFHWF